MAELAAQASYADYLALEAESDEKHEYIDGLILAMSGGTLEHGRLAMAAGHLLTRLLEGKPCRVFSSDARVRVESTNRSTYPDVSVVCGELERASDDHEAIANPLLLVEVLSESTERSDRGEKFAHYRRLESLSDYVLISQSERRVECFHRTDAGWMLTEAGAGERLHLASIEGELDVDALYKDTLYG
ncbi:MAG: Uma2 family endonuclease [Deltaproteobacteria bacterium]|nr:Uma2 family endonuclease [Deltaproteobacteria bacterium]